MDRLKSYYEKNEQRLTIAFFIGGFIFDLLMVERIDSWAMIGQQLIYLLLLLLSLNQIFFEQTKPLQSPEKMFLLKRWYFEYRSAAIHFFFGTLLNMYTIFFFKSSSLLMSFTFMAFLVFLIYANESPRFRAMGLTFKYALLSVCLLSFSSSIVPIFIGYMSKTVFLFSVALGCLPLVLLAWWIQIYRPTLFERAKNMILLPMLSVLFSYVALYFLKLTPPVPLSIPFIGVYHGVERSGEDYQLAHQRPWWKVWQNGDQEFIAQKGDKIYVAFRIFSPTRFSDQVAMRWFWYDNRVGWALQDSIPIKIVGGREEGFRGYGVKANYQPGNWKVQVETTDGREIGRVYFQLETGPEEPRSFDHDSM